MPCFSSFLAETRSSSSITAQLKDFAEGSFQLCRIDVTKNCNFVGVIASAPWQATFVTTALTFTDEALARAASAPGGAQTVTDTTTAPCQGTVSSAISITKECVPGTTLVHIGNNVVVEAGVSGQVTNNGQSRLTGITLAHNPAATVTLASSTLNPGESTSWSATYQPAAITSGDGTIPGRYFFVDTIRVTAATPAVGPSPSPVGGCPDPNDLPCAGASCPICPPGSCPPTP